MRIGWRSNSVFVALTLLVSGCGTTIPTLSEIGDKDIEKGVFKNDDGTDFPKLTATAQLEYEIVNRIHCALEKGVAAAQKVNVEKGNSPNGPFHVAQKGLFPDDWGAQVALSLQVDQTNALNPGLAINDVLPSAVTVFHSGSNGSVTTAQSFNLGFGATLSSTSTRIDKFNPFWKVADLARAKSDSTCQSDIFKTAKVKPPITPPNSSPLLNVEDDLGIEDWLVGAMFVNEFIPLSPQKASDGGGAPGAAGAGGGAKPESISLEIKFVVVSSANATPTWKLVNLSANAGNLPLLSAGRTRTHDLIITIGPPSQQTNGSHLASQINART